MFTMLSQPCGWRPFFTPMRLATVLHSTAVGVRSSQHYSWRPFLPCRWWPFFTTLRLTTVLHKPLRLAITNPALALFTTLRLAAVLYNPVAGGHSSQPCGGRLWLAAVLHCLAVVRRSSQPFVWRPFFTTLRLFFATLWLATVLYSTAVGNCLQSFGCEKNVNLNFDS